MTTSTDRRVRTPDGTSINVRTLSGSGHPIVFLHGFTGNAETMRPLAEGCRDGRTAHLIDVVGHGDSDSPVRIEPYEMSSVVDQILFAIGTHPPGHVHVVGYSMGGRIALAMGARAPWHFASIVAISATAGLADPIERAARHDADRDLADRIATAGLPAFVDAWLRQPLFEPLMERLDDDGREATRQQRLGNCEEGLIGSLLGSGTGSMPPLWDALAGLQTPLLAIAGELDPRYVEIAERMAARAPNGQVAIIENSGHALPLENPEAVATRLVEFLSGCETTPTA